MVKTIFITGASSGLGKATAKLFAKNGWKVIATMRNPQNERELTQHENIELFALDVTNAEQIKKVVNQITALTKIDVVFNNAGYGLAGPFEGATDEQIVQQINTNLLGVMRVTQAFIQHFRANEKGTFVTTTSIGGLLALPFNSVYHGTKWALEGWSESLAFELKPLGIKIKTVSPGGIATDFAGRSLVLTQHDAYADQMNQVLSVFMNPERAKDYSTAEQIAEYVWTAANDETEKLRFVAGADAKAMYDRRIEVGSEQASKEIENFFYGK
jgi:NAD(P)-dependent dehydrogenase (short-subunit alcohol dehydrogenase family)